jgi:RNA polymerase sigma-70 factor (ECF subfamily)
MEDTPLGSWTDEALVSEAQSDRDGPRGRAAASELLGRYRESAYLWSLRQVRDHDRALDLAQEALINAYRALPTFGGRAKFSSWLFAIVRNRCLTAVRKRSLTRDEEVDPDELTHPQSDPEAQLEWAQEESAVLDVLRRTLEPHEQRAVWMRYMDHLSVEEITRLLGLTGSTGARSVLQNARRKLRAAMTGSNRRFGGDA